MKLDCFGSIGLCLGTLLLMTGPALAAMPPSGASQQADETANQLLKEIRADAAQVRSTAANLDAMTANPGTSWTALDTKWNEIEPSVEDMQVKLDRLGAMASISTAERNEMNQSRVLIQEMARQQNEFRALLDKPGVQTSNPMFGTYSRNLRSEAGRLDRVTTAG